MSITEERIADDLRGIPVNPGTTLFVHSSLKSFGYVQGGPQTVIEALLKVVGEKGTVFVPTFTGKREDSPRNPPSMHISDTPCWTGLIPETFRKRKEARRSLHPTHSTAAIGPSTSFLQGEHHKGITPCDKKSPFYKNYLDQGLILLIGCDQESNTTIHCCEELAEVPYHIQKESTRGICYTSSGKRVEVCNYLHDWNKPPTDFNKLAPLFLRENIMTLHKVGNADVFCIDAVSMIDFTVPLLRKNPYFLVKEEKG